MLKGRHVDLRIVEREDLGFLHQWWNDPDYFGEYEPLAEQVSMANLEKEILEPKGNLARGTFIIQKKDGTRIGDINHRGGTAHSPMEIGYALVPSERGQGYATEAIQILVDYLFLTRDIPRIQATTLTANRASQRVLEKAGFRREGEMRRTSWVRGAWRDDYLYGLLREEWNGPRILEAGNP